MLHTSADPDAYPHARPGRGAGVDVAQLGPLVAPRTRLFPFYVRGTLNRRQTWSTPRLTGPAIIKEFALHTTNASDPPVSTVELGLAPAPVQEDAVLFTVPRKWNVITELLDPFALIASTGGDGFPMGTVPGATAYAPRQLNHVVRDAEFFVVVAFWCNLATTTAVAGHIIVLEGVDTEALRFFL